MFTDRYNRAQLPAFAGVPCVFDIPANNNVMWAKIIFRGSVTISGSTAAGTAIEDPGGGYRLFREIKFIATKAAGSRYPDGNLVRATPYSLMWYAAKRHLGMFIGAHEGDMTLGAGANGTYQIYWSVPVYFGGQRHENDGSTALNMNAADSQGNPVYQSVQVKVDLAATAGELFAGNDGALSFSGFVEYWDERMPLGDTIPIVQEDHIAQIYAPNERYVDQQLPRGGSFTDMLYIAQSGQPGLLRSNSIIERVEMEGPDISLKEYADDIQQDMIDHAYYEPGSDYVGIYYFNFTGGALSNAKSARGLSQRLALLNPSGSGNDQLKVFTRRVFPGVLASQ